MLTREKVIEYKANAKRLREKIQKMRPIISLLDEWFENRMLQRECKNSRMSTKLDNSMHHIIEELASAENAELLDQALGTKLAHVRRHHRIKALYTAKARKIKQMHKAAVEYAGPVRRPTNPRVAAAFNCCICLGSERDRPRATTPCKHTFHQDCILAWIAHNRTCPCCRASL